MSLLDSIISYSINEAQYHLWYWLWKVRVYLHWIQNISQTHKTSDDRTSLIRSCPLLILLKAYMFHLRYIYNLVNIHPSFLASLFLFLTSFCIFGIRSIMLLQLKEDPPQCLSITFYSIPNPKNFSSRFLSRHHWYDISYLKHLTVQMSTLAHSYQPRQNFLHFCFSCSYFK